MFGSNTLEKIRKLGEKGKAKKILPYASSKKAEERAAAAAALGCASDDDTCNALIGLLRDPVLAVRVNAAGALKKTGKASVIEHLRQAGKNATDEAFKAACNDAAASLASSSKA